jgi:ataxin-3
MLCAQHALNALLQGSYYDPSQLAGESGLPALLEAQALSPLCLSSLANIAPADIAAQMDDLEHAELDDAAWEARGRDEGSLNVDATGRSAAACTSRPEADPGAHASAGFFSLGVMEAALGIWNLSLERWRSASMREYHDAPEEQAAFVLNLQQHWFTIRGFGRGWW